MNLFRRIFLAIPIWSVWLPLCAQVSIDRADLPTAGSTIVLLRMGIPLADTGAVGVGATWDFDLHEPTGVGDVWTADQPGESPYSIYNFAPSATYWTANPFESTERFWTIDSDTLRLQVELKPFSDRWDVYSKPAKWLAFPFVYGDSFCDSLVAYSDATDYFPRITTRSQHGTDDHTYRKGTLCVEADGEGTLILPDGSSHSALRIHRRLVVHDSTSILGGLSYRVDDLVIDQYTWYLDDWAFPILLIEQTEGLINGFIPTSSSRSRWMDPSTLQQPETSIPWAIGPNPASTSLTVWLGEGLNGSYRLMDYAGQVWKEGSLLGAQTTIALPSLAAGLYLLELRSAGVLHRRRVMINGD